MHPSIRVLRSHQPLIRFIGKRSWAGAPEAPHAHPAAPAEFKQNFSDFVEKWATSASNSSPSPSSNAKKPFGEFWEAPQRFWKRDIEDVEINAIISGGASLH